MRSPSLARATSLSSGWTASACGSVTDPETLRRLVRGAPLARLILTD